MIIYKYKLQNHKQIYLLIQDPANYFQGLISLHQNINLCSNLIYLWLNEYQMKYTLINFFKVFSIILIGYSKDLM